MHTSYKGFEERTAAVDDAVVHVLQCGSENILPGWERAVDDLYPNDPYHGRLHALLGLLRLARVTADKKTMTCWLLHDARMTSERCCSEGDSVMMGVTYLRARYQDDSQTMMQETGLQDVGEIAEPIMSTVFPYRRGGLWSTSHTQTVRLLRFADTLGIAAGVFVEALPVPSDKHYHGYLWECALLPLEMHPGHVSPTEQFIKWLGGQTWFFKEVIAGVDSGVIYPKTEASTRMAALARTNLEHNQSLLSTREGRMLLRSAFAFIAYENSTFSDFCSTFPLLGP